MSSRLLIHQPSPQSPPLVCYLKTQVLNVLKHNDFGSVNIWLLLPRFWIPKNTFSNCLLHALTVIHSHLLDFQKFSNRPNYWDHHLFGTQEYVRIKKQSISAFSAEIEWSLVLTDINGIHKYKEFILYVFVILGWETSVSRPTKNEFE